MNNQISSGSVYPRGTRRKVISEKEMQFILSEREGQYIEFKESFDKKSFAKEIVAFANASGGKIFLGVNDYAEVKGIKITNKLKSQIQDLANNCDPKIVLSFEEFSTQGVLYNNLNFESEGKNILIVEVLEGENKPYSCSSGFYLRTGPNSQKMKRDEILNLAIKGGKIRFDEQICKDFDWKDFDEEKFDYYLKLAKISKNLDREDILRNLKVLTNEGFTNAGVLFFAKVPYKYISTSRVRCVYFKDNKRVKILDKKEVDRGIIGNIEFAVNYLKDLVPVEFEIQSLARKEQFSYPENAYREAIINAIVHRDYFNGDEVAVEKLKDFIIINNKGCLLFDIKDFGKKSELRNRLIADLLSKTDYMEKVGTGIQRIKFACLNNGNKIEFDVNGEDFFVKIYNKILVEKTRELIDKDNLNFVDAKLTQVDAKLTQILGTKEKQILLFIFKNKKINSTNVQNLFNISREMANRYFKNLINKKLIVRKGKSKLTYYILGGCWKVK